MELIENGLNSEESGTRLSSKDLSIQGLKLWLNHNKLYNLLYLVQNNNL